jgi:DNA-binding GntR family transcriptional regulator
LKAVPPFQKNKLAADFEVSRSPIREALKTLASENLIRLERMGAVVITKPVMESFILLAMRARFEEKYNDFPRIVDNHQLYIDAIDAKNRDLMILSLHQNFDDVQGKVEDLWRSQLMLNKGVVQE